MERYGVCKSENDACSIITLANDICNDIGILKAKLEKGNDNRMQKDKIEKVKEYTLLLEDVVEKADSVITNSRDESVKMPFLMHLLDTMISSGEYVLIFSQGIFMLNRVQGVLEKFDKDKRYSFKRMDGETPQDQRDDIVEKFQQGEFRIFLLTTRVGGFGITLTRANNVIILDPSWTPSIDDQCADRVYRISQKKDVKVYRIFTCGTTEERMFEAQVVKRQLSMSVIDQKTSASIVTGHANERLSVPGADLQTSKNYLKFVQKGGDYIEMNEDEKNLGVYGIMNCTKFLSKMKQDWEANFKRQLNFSPPGRPAVRNSSCYQRSGSLHDCSSSQVFKINKKPVEQETKKRGGRLRLASGGIPQSLRAPSPDNRKDLEDDSEDCLTSRTPKKPVEQDQKTRRRHLRLASGRILQSLNTSSPDDRKDIEDNIEDCLCSAVPTRTPQAAVRKPNKTAEPPKLQSFGKTYARKRLP